MHPYTRKQTSVRVGWYIFNLGAHETTHPHAVCALIMAPRGRVSSAWLFEHGRLERTIAHAPSARLEPSRDGAPSILLLGIISVSPERRSLIRCTWGKALNRLPTRLLFVVGLNASDAGSSDTFQTPVEERLLAASSNRAKTRRASGATYSSLSSFLKTFHFIKFAALQPEPLVGLGDDDIFVQPHALVAQYVLVRGRPRALPFLLAHAPCCVLR